MDPLKGIGWIPEGLIEISHDSIIAKLKGYCRDNYQDLYSISQDPMKTTIAPAYRKHLPLTATEAELEAIMTSNDPTGDKNKIFMGLRSGKNNQYLKLLGQQDIFNRQFFSECHMRFGVKKRFLTTQVPYPSFWSKLQTFSTQ